jgi:hypothetical protein
VSFIGYVRPLVQGDSAVTSYFGLALPVGFAVSSSAIFAVLAGVGSSLAGVLPPLALLIIAVVLIGLVVVVDASHPRLPLPMLRRQTPRGLAHRFPPQATLMLWGLDTGTVVSTYRVTGMSWSALLLAATGSVPWWSGLTYAAGFSLPLLVLANWRHPLPRSIPRATHRDIVNQLIVQRLFDWEPVLRRFAVAVQIVAIGVLIVTGIESFR